MKSLKNKNREKRWNGIKKKYGLNITLVVSLLALIIAGRTCIDTKRGTNVAENQGMPFIQVVDLRLIEPVNKTSFITLDLTVKNLGGGPATKVSAEMDYTVGDSGPANDGNSATRRKINDIGQGFEKTIRLKSNRINRSDWRTKGANVYNTGYFYGTIFYDDRLSGKRKKVDWCYELPLRFEDSLNQLILNPSTYYTFESEYDVEKQ